MSGVSQSTPYIERDNPGQHFFRTERPRNTVRTDLERAAFARFLDHINAERRQRNARVRA